MSEPKTSISEDYRERATVFRVFARQTIDDWLRAELLRLAGWYESLAAHTERRRAA